MEEWKEYKLIDVCENIYSGGTPSSMIASYWNGNLPWLSSGETNQRYIYYTEKSITKEGADNSSTRYAFEGSTVIASAGQGHTRGQASMLCIDTYVNQSVLVLKPNPLIINPHFLYFNLDSRYNELRQLSDGCSTRGSLSGKILKDLKIYLPSLNEQLKIVSILKSLDDKIEVNRRINDNLEQQAQALFKSWFVDFEPFQNGEFVDSELGRIPKGWKVGKLSEIANITMGQSPSGSTYNENHEGTEFYQGSADFGWRFPNERVYTTEPLRFAESNSILMSVRAPVGTMNISLNKCCIGRGLASIQSKDNSNSFVFYLMDFLKPLLNSYNGDGTVFGSINKKSLETLPIIKPPQDVIDSFEKIVSPLDGIIKNNSVETKTLSTLRDTLLPKLMSGEIEV